MTKDIQFTIITVCYNAEDCIEKTIKSVILQNYFNYEYIIIDGKSTDNTINIIRDLTNEKSFIKVICEKDNGIYDAMNKGINISNGEYIFFLNAGDIFYDRNVLKSIHKKTLGSENDLVYGNFIKLHNNIFKFKKTIKRITKLHFLLDRTICHQTIFTKRDVFNSVGLFNTNYKISADYNWLIMCSKECMRIKHTSLKICIFNMNGISSRSSKLIQEEHEKVIKNHFNNYLACLSRIKHYLGNILR